MCTQFTEANLRTPGLDIMKCRVMLYCDRIAIHHSKIVNSG